jgi:hypothetical protein
MSTLLELAPRFLVGGALVSGFASWAGRRLPANLMWRDHARAPA